MVAAIRAERDARLGAAVVRRTALRYTGGALDLASSGLHDLPAHVRAASGVARVGGRLAVIQDDTNAVALVDPSTVPPAVDAVLLPRGADGLRQFDDLRGNKRYKLDLEACLGVAVSGRAALVAFGSGSTRARERLVVVFADGPPEGRVRLVPAPGFYASLRSRREFSGSELNVEGAALCGGRLRLFQRGNGEVRGGLLPVDATAEVAWDEFEQILGGSDRAVDLHDVTQYDLGHLGGVRLTFTDAAAGPGGSVLYLATAEASPDAVRDGPVTGSVLGVIAERRARWTALTLPDGSPLAEKAEGVVLRDDDPARAFAVLDADDPARPAELCEIALSGPWFSRSPPG